MKIHGRNLIQLVFKAIDRENWEECVDLSVSKEQVDFLHQISIP